MAEYNLGFSEKLIAAAQFVADQDNQSEDAARTVLYLSCLACEIALKALLECSGKPISEIMKLHHNLTALMNELDRCKVQTPIVRDFLVWVPATRLRAITVDNRFANATVGAILNAEERGASSYPNKIRYGNIVQHYPHQLVLETAILVLDWAKEHRDGIVS